MGGLFQYAVVCLLSSVLLLHIYDAVIGDRLANAAHVVRPTLFVSAWTGITTVLGMRWLTKGVRGLRQNAKEVSNRISPIHKDERIL